MMMVVKETTPKARTVLAWQEAIRSPNLTKSQSSIQSLWGREQVTLLTILSEEEARRTPMEEATRSWSFLKGRRLSRRGSLKSGMGVMTTKQKPRKELSTSLASSSK